MKNGAPVAAAKDASSVDASLKTWVHVRAELAVAPDGFVERTLTLGTATRVLARFDPAVAFDGVRVACGIENAYAGGGSTAQVTIFMKDLKVTACKSMRP